MAARNHALLYALDRIFDDATVFNIKGESFRGKRLEAVALQTSRVEGSGFLRDAYTVKI